MNRINAAGCDSFIRGLMNDVSPDEIPLIADYKAALAASSSGAPVGGLEFGLEDALVALGPLVIFAGTKVFSDLGDWALSRAEDVLKKYIVKGAQRLLACWLDKPVKGGLNDVLTEDGKKEIISIVRTSFKGSKIPREKVDKVIAALEQRLFAP